MLLQKSFQILWVPYSSFQGKTINNLTSWLIKLARSLLWCFVRNLRFLTIQCFSSTVETAVTKMGIFVEESASSGWKKSI